MKHLITLFILLFTSLGFAQNTGLIVGKVLDKELDNSPLLFASISIKETGLETTTDQTGLFIIENLEDGNYTLVCSFVGYETKELKVKVASGKSDDLKIALGASTFSLADIASITSVAQKEDKTTSALN